jgi:hypothetical protein
LPIIRTHDLLSKEFSGGWGSCASSSPGKSSPAWPASCRYLLETLGLLPIPPEKLEEIIAQRAREQEMGVDVLEHLATHPAVSG